MTDQLADGRRFRALTILDVFTRESLAIEVGQRLKGDDVVQALNTIRWKRGVPKVLFCDNGSGFTSQIMDPWVYHNRVQIDFSRPSKPTDNVHVESFSRTFRFRVFGCALVYHLDRGQAGHRILEAGIQLGFILPHLAM